MWGEGRVCGEVSGVIVKCLYTWCTYYDYDITDRNNISILTRRIKNI